MNERRIVMDGPDPREEPYIDQHDPNPSEVLDDISARRDGTKGWYPTDVDETETIWRYMSLGKFISLLQKEQLWFSHRSKFEDPYEGRYSQSAAEKIQKERWDIEEPDDEDTEYFVDDNADDYVTCWNIKKSQSAALWKIYVEGSNGVAIKTTVGELKNSIDRSALSQLDISIEFGRVKYHSTGEEPIGHYAPIFTKRDIFDFEKEYRVVLTDDESLEDIDVDGIEVRPGIGVGVKIEPRTLINEVYIAPSAGGYLRDVVENLRDDYGPDYSIEKSTVHPSLAKTRTA
ncbi:hypothetical protein [Halobellus sp. Atlit-38R]|uniref:hypothetical protein n=1 Tax=Halobellus sp. Atlit-38R TaxID=2282131 RepID=UPI0011C46B3C|nr:hypothetical protein [Halobellus sp. Atlit-38R]